MRSTDIFKNEIKELICSIFYELHLALECILISFIYLEKLINKSKIELRANNWRPLILTSIILASKYWEDCGFWNYDFLDFVNYPIRSVNVMESKFINLLEYDVYVNPHTYVEYYKKVTSIYANITKSDEKERRKAEYRKHGFMKSKKNRRSALLS